ncbi:MAG: hypothetical protein ACI4NM_00165 [Bullifex sp.]
MAKRSMLGSVLSVISLSVIVFFLIYFFAPEAADQFFGTSVRDGKVNESVSVIMDAAKASGTYTQEQLDGLEDYLKSGKARNTLVKIGKVTADGAAEFLNVMKDSL